jgi:hypothetical protein
VISILGGLIFEISQISQLSIFTFFLMDRNYVIDEVGGLNSIIKPFNNDLVNKVLLVTIRKLRRMTPFALFLVYIHFLHDPINGRLP